MIEAQGPLVLQKPMVSKTSENAGFGDHLRQPNNVHHTEPLGISLSGPETKEERMTPTTRWPSAAGTEAQAGSQR